MLLFRLPFLNPLAPPNCLRSQLTAEQCLCVIAPDFHLGLNEVERELGELDLRKKMTEREREIRKAQILERQMERLEKCLIAEEKAENARRRYWARRGGAAAQMMSDYKRWVKRREKEGLPSLTALSLLRTEPKH
jgi:hypothetical protein